MSCSKLIMNKKICALSIDALQPYNIDAEFNAQVKDILVSPLVLLRHKTTNKNTPSVPNYCFIRSNVMLNFT